MIGKTFPGIAWAITKTPILLILPGLFDESSQNTGLWRSNFLVID